MSGIEKDFYDVISERDSVRVFEKDATLSKEEIEEIIRVATTAPSAWNLQHWKFLIFHSDEAKKRLLPIAYNQEAITDCCAVIAVLGDAEANKNFEHIYSDYVDKSIITNEVKDSIGKQINGAYSNGEFARDAAFSNSSLVAMQLMLASQAKGYDTLAIGGFNSRNFSKEFNVESRYIPNMLIVIGKGKKEAHKTTRFKVEDVTKWI